MHQGARDMPLPAVHGRAGGALLRGVQEVRQPVPEGQEGWTMRYGMPYQGSKSRIAEWVVDTLPKSHTLVDLFAGGVR